MSSFLDREQEIAEVKRLLATARLVTLTGVGGTGKTRLAVRVAREVGRAFADGVWLVEVGPLTDGSLLDHAVAATLGIRDTTDRPLRHVLAERLRGAELLIVLDGCEHLLSACAELAGSVLRAAPDVRLVCTSRQPLGLLGETVLTVRPLPVPDEGVRLPVAAAAQYPGVALFAERAAAAAPGFALTPDVQDLVLEVCRRLDGLPLAIEMAAAQLRTIPLAQLAAGLTDRSRMLAALPAPPSYHRPLRETFDWSYDLCSPAEQTLWARLAVFAGSFDLAAATGVCAGGDLSDVDILDLIAGLIDKSVLVRDDDAGEARYRLLDTVRRYGMERLPGGTDELTALCQRHRDWYLGRAERFDAEWFGPGQESRSARMRADLDNMRAALVFCLTTDGEEAAGLRLAVALRFYWFRCGASREGRLWLDRALAADTAASPARAAALACHSVVLGMQSDGAGAAGSAQAAIDLATRLHAPHLVARAEAYLGVAVLLSGRDLPRAQALCEGAVRSLTALGEVSDTVATARVCLATVVLHRGDVRRATDLATQARAYCRNHGDHSCLTVALYGSANIALAAGDPRRADDFLRECLPLQYDLNDTFGMPIAIETMATVAAVQGDNRRAARLLGAAHGVRRVVGKRFAGTADFQRRRLGTAERVRQALGEATFETAFRRGAALSLEETVTYALGRGAEAGPVDAPPPGGLTPRERDVADLVAEGLSNRQIAARLGVSQRTVESHVENILRKLGFVSRTQVAAWITRQRPTRPG